MLQPLNLHWPAIAAETLRTERVAGGLSDARVLRVVAQRGDFALRSWPTDTVSRNRIALAHRMLLAARKLPWTPQLEVTVTGATWGESDSVLWELATWLPGSSALPGQATAAERRSAADALAQLTNIWQRLPEAQVGVSPGVQRRAERLQTAWREVDLATLSLPAPIAAQLAVLQARLPALRAKASALLAPAILRRFALSPTLVDLRAANVLFVNERVTAVLDYGAASVDTPWLTLARLVSDLAGDDATARDEILAAYLKRDPTQEEISLVTALEASGLAGAILNWLTWLTVERRALADGEAVATRLRELVERT